MGVIWETHALFLNFLKASLRSSAGVGVCVDIWAVMGGVPQTGEEKGGSRSTTCQGNAPFMAGGWKRVTGGARISSHGFCFRLHGQGG